MSHLSSLSYEGNSTLLVDFGFESSLMCVANGIVFVHLVSIFSSLSMCGYISVNSDLSVTSHFNHVIANTVQDTL